MSMGGGGAIAPPPPVATLLDELRYWLRSGYYPPGYATGYATINYPSGYATGYATLLDIGCSR